MSTFLPKVSGTVAVLPSKENEVHIYTLLKLVILSVTLLSLRFLGCSLMHISGVIIFMWQTFVYCVAASHGPSCSKCSVHVVPSE